MGDLDQRHVDLTNVNARFHRVQIRHRHHFRACHLAGAHNAFAQLGVQFADRPGQWRIDRGFGEVGFRVVQLRARDADLFDGAVEGRFGNVIRGLRCQVIGLGNQLRLEKRVVAFVFQVGLFEIGGGRVPIGHGRFVARVGLIAGGQIIVRLDFKEQIALGDVLALLDRHHDDFAGDFGADIDLNDRLYLAIAGHDLRDIAAEDFILGNGDWGIVFAQFCGHQARSQEDAEYREDNQLFFAFSFRHLPFLRCIDNSPAKMFQES